MHLRALLLVGFVMSVTRADVSHLTTSNYASNSLHTNEAAEQQPDFVSINFNNKIASSAGNNNNKYKYWWMNTETSPFSDIPHPQKTRADSQSQHKNTLHDTHDIREHQQQQSHFTRNPNNNIYAHMTSLSGSPSEVNNLMFDTPSQSNYIARQYSPQSKTPCYGATQVCAPKDACDNDGFISEKNLGLVLSQANECDSRLESCCNIQPDQPEQQQQQKQDDQSDGVCSDANSACVMARFCYNGFIDQSAEHNAVRTPTCKADEVCCRFSDRRRQAPSYDDHDFAAAEGTSEVLTKEGYVVNVPSNQYLPSFPDPEYNPDASNDDPSKLRPSTQAPPQRPVQTTTQRQYQQPSTTTQRPYQPPSTTQRQYQQPSSTTQRPYQQPSTTQRPYRPEPSNPRPVVNVEDQAVSIVPSACPAAMNCTKEEYCTAIGWISKEPVVLNEFQKSFRVPMTDCMIMPQRELGKCCRDPDYTDPWPVGRTGQYVADELNAVFDSGAYKPQRGQASNQAKSAASNQVITRVSAPQVQRSAPAAAAQQQTRLNREIPKRQPQNVQQSSNSVQRATESPIAAQAATCGVRNYNTQPRGRAPLGTGFGEFTWVAMIILESKKALLCGGTIIDKNVVATSGNCVTGYRHNDVLIKAGEWRLGSDEEPKPFQIVRVKKIVFHPQFKRDTLEHDIALLHLENDIRYDSHIGPICLDDQVANVSPSDNCVTTGWGKEVLKVHLGNALMQHTPVSALSDSDCQSRLTSAQVNFFESVICGATQQDVCEVDPGSALACADASGRYVFKGVLSADTGCNSLAVYNRADLSWIKSFISGARPHYN